MILSAGSLQLLTFQNAYSKMWWASYVQAVHWSSRSLWSWCFLHQRSAQMNRRHMAVTQRSCWRCVVWQLCREHTANPQTHTESRDRPTQPHQVANWVARSPSTVSKANSSISWVLNRGDIWLHWKLKGTQGKKWPMCVTFWTEVTSGCTGSCRAHKVKSDSIVRAGAIHILMKALLAARGHTSTICRHQSGQLLFMLKLV